MRTFSKSSFHPQCHVVILTIPPQEAAGFLLHRERPAMAGLTLAPPDVSPKAYKSLLHIGHASSLAGRRDDAVHPQVFHYLPVMIGGMRQRADNHFEARDRSLPERIFEWRQQILFVDRGDGFVQIG